MPTTKGTIFINYRKDDSNWNALALYNELLKYFSEDQLFKDFNAILPGDDFVVSIEKALTKCDVLLVIIGRQWLNVKNIKNIRRLDDVGDYVRMEIATALDRRIQVIPVLFDNTPMPTEEDLPENLRALSRRQAIEINPKGFEDDVRHLADAIKKVLREDDTSPPANKNFKNTATQNLQAPPKPENYLVWAIITTVLCCLPLGIVSIMHASKVDNLYNSGQYDAAQAESAKAKQWAMYAAIIGIIVYTLYFIGVSVNRNNANSY